MGSDGCSRGILGGLAELAGEPGGDAGAEVVEGGGDGVECGELAGGEQGWPPTDADADVTDDEEGGGGDNEQQKDGASPAEALLKGVAAEHAGLADIGGEFSPASVVVNDLSGGAIGAEEALGPVLGIEAEGAGVSADDAFGEDSAGEEAKAFLLQRHEVVLADFGDRRYFFQRNAAGEPLHAQVFTKVAHFEPCKPGKVPDSA